MGEGLPAWSRGRGCEEAQRSLPPGPARVDQDQEPRLLALPTRTGSRENRLRRRGALAPKGLRRSPRRDSRSLQGTASLPLLGMPPCAPPIVTDEAAHEAALQPRLVFAPASEPRLA